MSRKVAIVTGGSSGIGAATALALAEAECNVIVTYCGNLTGGESTARNCIAEGVEAFAVKADVSCDADCRAVAQRAIEAWGRIDVLINNAGTTRFVDATDFDALSADDFEGIFAVNVTGCYQMTRAAASSHSGFSGIGSSIAYSASKGALNTMTLSLALSLAPNVRVNAICPGFVDTNWMASKLDADALAAFKIKTTEITPLKCIPSAENIAEAALWFALGGVPATGQLLVVDGGTHLTVGDPL